MLIRASTRTTIRVGNIIQTETDVVPPGPYRAFIIEAIYFIIPFKMRCKLKYLDLLALERKRNFVLLFPSKVMDYGIIKMNRVTFKTTMKRVFKLSY